MGPLFRHCSAGICYQYLSLSTHWDISGLNIVIEMGRDSDNER